MMALLAGAYGGGSRRRSPRGRALLLIRLALDISTFGISFLSEKIQYIK